MKRSCQRQTQVFDLPVRRMISLVPTPSALNRTISARQTCLCGALRSRASAFSRRRSVGLRVMEIPVRMRQTRMHPATWESLQDSNVRRYPLGPRPRAGAHRARAAPAGKNAPLVLEVDVDVGRLFAIFRDKTGKQKLA